MHVSNHEKNQHTAVIAAAGRATDFLYFRIGYDLNFYQAIFGWILDSKGFHRVIEHPNPSYYEGVMHVSNHEENQHTAVIAAAGRATDFLHFRIGYDLNFYQAIFGWILDSKGFP